MSIHVISNPLTRHKLGLLRDITTSTSEFRRIANELASILIYEAAKSFPLEKEKIKTWAGELEVEKLSGKKLTIVPILRAGLGLMDGALAMIPSARISVVGLYRDESTLEPVQYFSKLAKDMKDRDAIILDPMLATGGSLDATIDILKKSGCPSIASLHLVCAPEGVDRISRKHPDVDIYTASIDERLNAHGYILPGLGDAGDRIFGTK